MAPPVVSTSPRYSLLSASIPAHDSVTVRIRWPNTERRDRVVLVNKAGTKTFVQRARWNRDWAMARFRQFGTYQAVVDEETANGKCAAGKSAWPR
jgi:hypothetical protein